MNRPKGGYAQPVEWRYFSDGVIHKQIEPGMTLRDYFAAAALAGMLSAVSARAECPTANASRAYALADAMLAEREKE